MAGNFTEMDNIKKRKFLNAFAETGGITQAERASGVSRQSHYHWIKDDPLYTRLFAEAREMAGNVLEAEAVRRAMKGSDLLLIFLLKGAKPEQYKERVQINVEERLRAVADELGLDANEVIAEAMRVVSGKG